MPARLLQRAALHALLIVLCATLVTVPLWRYSPSCGHDFDFHLQSWFAANAFWSGNAHAGGAGLAGLLRWPHWVSPANYGAGEPRLVFYPPASWLLGAGLGTVLPWTLVPQAFTLLALSGCGLAFYTLARHWVPDDIAAGAACVYLANPYLLFVAYERTAYGELLGAIFIPPVFLWALCERPPVLRLACTIAALWFSNAPAAVMGCYLAGFCAVAAALQARSLLPLLRTLGAITLGLGLAAIYILPAWYEQRWVEIARAIDPGMRVEDSFLFGHAGEAFHDQVLHTASWIAVVLLAAGLFALATAWLGERKAHIGVIRNVADKSPVLALGSLLLLILMLMTRWSEHFWQLAPELRFLQFPWRWLLVVGVASAFALALAAYAVLGAFRGALHQLGSTRKRASFAAVAFALCAGCWGAGLYAQHHYAQPCDDEDNVPAQRALLTPDAPPTNPQASIPGFEGTDEYTARGADNGEIQQGLPVVRLLPSPDADEGDDTQTPNPDWTPSPPAPGIEASVQAWQSEHMRLTVNTRQAAFAVLRLMDYPAWHVTLNGRPATRLRREDGLLTMELPPGVSEVAVDWQATPDLLAGRGISALSLCILLTLAIRAHKRKARAVAPQPLPASRGEAPL